MATNATTSSKTATETTPGAAASTTSPSKTSPSTTTAGTTSSSTSTAASTPTATTPAPPSTTVVAQITDDKIKSIMSSLFPEFANDNAPPPKGPKLIYLAVSAVAVLAFYLLKTQEFMSPFAMVMEVIVWFVFITMLLLVGIARIFDVDVIAMIKKLVTSPVPQIPEKPADKTPTPTPTPVPAVPLARDQVFHVSDNKYNYSDAKAICQALGARLATYKEMDKAYDDGANWCSYGWTDGQMGMFPIQESYYNTLQGIAGHEHDCGRPGVNGGYFPDANMQFGVNCYGKKPDITKKAATAMQDNSPIPVKSAKEKEFDQRVEFWKGKVNDLTIAPFNQSAWALLS